MGTRRTLTSGQAEWHIVNLSMGIVKWYSFRSHIWWIDMLAVVSSTIQIEHYSKHTRSIIIWHWFCYQIIISHHCDCIRHSFDIDSIYTSHQTGVNTANDHRHSENRWFVNSNCRATIDRSSQLTPCGQYIKWYDAMHWSYSRICRPGERMLNRNKLQSSFSTNYLSTNGSNISNVLPYFWVRNDGF